MSTNKKQPSRQVTSLASEKLKDPKASAIQKQLAGSLLSQSNTSNQTGAEMEDLASKVLKSSKYNKDTKALAGSVLSQANKER